MATDKKNARGFAAMDPKRLKEISSKGGKASHGGGKSRSSTAHKKK